MSLNINLDTLLISDTHFDHKNIEKFCPSRKVILEQSNKHYLMEDILIDRIWTSNKGKTILHLGDFAFKGINKYKDKISNANNILLPGNHDKKHLNNYLFNGFSSVIEGIWIYQNELEFSSTEKLPPFCNAYIKKISGIKIMFTHFPLFHECKYDKEKTFYKSIELLENLFNEYECDLNIHGHTHEVNSKFKKSFNVSLENLNFKPISLKDILERKI